MNLKEVLLGDLATYDKAEIKVDKKVEVRSTYLIEKIELPLEEPVWCPTSVKPGQIISIKAIIEYLNIDPTNKRKSVLLIRSYDKSGKEVNVAFEEMFKSKTFDAYFKYLGSTQNRFEELYECVVPEGVSTIHFGFSRFLCSENEKVVVSDLVIYPKAEVEVNKVEVNKKVKVRSTYLIEKIELPLEVPVWYPTAVKSGQSISIKAMVEYLNIAPAIDRKAVLLIKAYDDAGNEVDFQLDKMFQSDAFGAQFKYLAPTQGEVEELYTFIAPEGVSTIHFGFSRFLCSDDEQVVVSDLNIYPHQVREDVSVLMEKQKISKTVSDIEDDISSKMTVAALPNKLITENELFEIVHEVNAEQEYILRLSCVTDDESNTKGAVADITFYDIEENVLPKPYTGTNSSKLFEAYFYIETMNLEEPTAKRYKIVAPKGASQVKIKIVAFNCKNGFKLIDDYEFLIKEELYQKNFDNSLYLETFNNILSEAEQIPDSNGSEYFSKHNYRVGVIGDVYMYNFYKDVFVNVDYLSPSNYQEVLDKGLDIVIYTTCWKGISNEEWKGVKFREKPKNGLDDILKQAKEKNIKTVFQTIEDPSNFEYFLPVAEKFEYILTTDTDCIDRYKKELNHERVYYGEYGVNPQFNNPIGSRRNIRNAAFFAGSYPKRYEERCSDMEIIFDSIIESNGDLLIADRNYDADSDSLKYPARFQSNVLPPVRHDLLQKVHKLFRYNLNFNSIKQSPTMCAMRVYELQAQGNGLISNYANSVYNKFPSIRMIPFKQNMSLDFDDKHELEEYRRNTNSIREVLNDKTSYHVVSTLLTNIGLKNEDEFNKNIAVICEKKTEKVLSSFENQAYSNKILIEESEIADWDDIKEKHDIEYFCWFSSTYLYENNYLNDLLNGFKYTDSRYITKNAYFDDKGSYIKGKEHEYTNICSSKHLSLFSTSYLKPSDLPSITSDESFILDRGYSIDPFEVNYISYMQNEFKYVNDYALSVIVPVYNNAKFLTSKCIPSLQRNSIWSKMEVLLIDDGSTDTETLQALSYLESIYTNIKVTFNHGNGSGSASRPRNQGIDLAKAPIVTFLDPDNEIAPGAYDLLVDLYYKANSSSSESVDFISGFHVKVSEDVRVIGKHTSNELSIIKNFKKGYFDKGRFPVIATQSAVISKKLLNDHNIRFVEGSAGQDTLFGWELIANSKCGGFNGEAYIIYYADRSDSITNVVDIDYFNKKLILERQQVNFLQKNGLFESYIINHFDNFMKNWYFVKLNKVAENDYNNALSIISKICNMYGKNVDNYL